MADASIKGDVLSADSRNKNAQVPTDQVADFKSVLIVLGGLSALILAVSLMFALVLKPKTKGALSQVAAEKCSSPDCAYLSSAFTESINSSADPCDDFYEYVCGNFRSASGSMLKQTEDELWQRVREALSNVSVPQNNQDESVFYGIAALYRSCKRVAEEDNSPAVKTLMDNLTIHFNVDNNGDAVTKVLRLSYLYKFQTQFAVELVRLNPNSDRRILVVEFNQAYIERIKKAGFKGRDQEDTFYREYLDVYDKTLGPAQDSIIARIRDVEVKATRLLLEHSSAKFNETSMDLLEGEQPALEFYSTPPVRSYIMNLLRYVSYEGVNLLFAWDVLRYLAPMASSKLASTNPKNVHERRCWTYILALTATPAATAYLLQAVPSTKRRAMQNMSRTIQNYLISRADGTHSFWSRAAAKKLESVSVKTRFPRNVASIDELDALYPKILDENAPFLENWRSVLQGIFRKGASLGHDPTSDATPNAIFHFKKGIVISPTMMLRPLFSVDGVAAVNYGGLGHVIAHQMIRAAEILLFDDSSSKSLDAKQKYKKKLVCLQESYDATLRAPGENSSNVGFFEVANLLGLLAAHSTFSREKRHLGTERLTSEEQLFFIAACYKFCESSSTSVGPSSKARCTLPLMHTQGFADAFQCGHNTRMNPPKKCSFW